MPQRSPLGILIHGANHFIVQGPLPSLASARRLVWAWELPLPGRQTPDTAPWALRQKAFREDLSWAVALEGAGKPSEAAETLVEELRRRGVVVHQGPGPLLAFTPSDGQAWVGE